MEFVVPDKMRVLVALRQIFPQSSRRTLQHWLKGGRFLLDNGPIDRDDLLLEKGQILSSQKSFCSKKSGDVKIIFEDRHLIVIDKPVGLLSVPLDTPSSKRNALFLLRNFYQTDQIFAVHRIDRKTSGTLLFARGTESEEKFKDLFEKHDLHREYFAIVEGRLPEERGTWVCNLKELHNFDVEICYDPDEGKQAITHFEVWKRSAKYTYIRCLLETGRKHQIRVHCKEAGFPVLGDKRYGAIEDPIRRLALHAQKLAFTHPFTKRNLSFTSPLPFPFKKLGATDQALSKSFSSEKTTPLKF